MIRVLSWDACSKDHFSTNFLPKAYLPEDDSFSQNREYVDEGENSYLLMLQILGYSILQNFIFSDIYPQGSLFVLNVVLPRIFALVNKKVEIENEARLHLHRCTFKKEF